MLNKKAITLVEVILAILVFGIGILTIVSMIIKNFFVVDQIKNKTQATFLAKEGIEIMYNFRDTNLDKGLNRKCVQVNSNYECIEYFDENKKLKVSMDIQGYYNIESIGSLEDAKLYYHTKTIKDNHGVPIMKGFWYDYDDTGKETFFYRYIEFDKAYLAPEGGYADTDKLLKIRSYVFYKKGGYTGDVVLESFIGKIR